jgi:hypothetical protein
MDFEKMTADHDMEDLYNDTKMNDSQQRSQGYVCSLHLNTVGIRKPDIRLSNG